MNLITSHNLILPKYLLMVKSQGSKNSKARAREGGASAFTAMSSFFSVPPSVRPKVSVPVPFEQEKSGRGVWGEFRFSLAKSK